MDACVHTHVHAHKHTHTHTQTHTRTHVHAHTSRCTHTLTCTHLVVVWLIDVVDDICRFEKPLTKKWDYPGTYNCTNVYMYNVCLCVCLHVWYLTGLDWCLFVYFSAEMGSQAAADALRDAGLSYNDLQAAVASYCYGDPTCGQRALYGIYMCTFTLYNGWFILYITTTYFMAEWLS